MNELNLTILSENSDFITFKCTNSNIGFIEVIQNKKHNTLTIVYLFVHKKFRHKGYGTELIKRVIYYAFINNISEIHLDDITTINGVNNIYYKLGFNYVNFKFGPEMILKI